jgi:hypothetical protein
MEEIDLTWQFHKEPLDAWRVDHAPYWREAVVHLGRLADGRWYAKNTRVPTEYASADEAEIRRLVDDWLTDGQRWVPTPAKFNSKGQPADGRTWRTSGATWILND